ncbi:MAG: hypothetical protein ACLFP4_11210 [Spirochaetales bacterium]
MVARRAPAANHLFGSSYGRWGQFTDYMQQFAMDPETQFGLDMARRFGLTTLAIMKVTR